MYIRHEDKCYFVQSSWPLCKCDLNVVNWQMRKLTEEINDLPNSHSWKGANQAWVPNPGLCSSISVMRLSAMDYSHRIGSVFLTFKIFSKTCLFSFKSQKCTWIFPFQKFEFNSFQPHSHVFATSPCMHFSLEQSVGTWIKGNTVTPLPHLSYYLPLSIFYHFISLWGKMLEVSIITYVGKQQIFSIMR